MVVAELRFILDGRPVQAEAPAHWPLVRVLRELAGERAVKVACGEGACGACAVLVDGTLVHSCIYPAGRVEGRSVTTAAGLRDGPVAAELIERGAPQCGFCSPGFVVSATALVEAGEARTAEEVREGLAGNLCRCTGYHRTIDAVLAAVVARDGEEP